MQRIKIHTPNYTIDAEPDCKAIGALIDAQIKKYFMGKKILLRGVGSQDHPGKTRDDIIEIIGHKGTDRYDPGRVGDRYENVEGKHIDLFAFPAIVEPRMQLAWQVIYGFYHGAIEAHGHAVRIDILTVYDAGQFAEVAHHYAGRTDIKRRIRFY